MTLSRNLPTFMNPSTAFIAIGHVASAVGSEMQPFLDSIMFHIKAGLQMRGYVTHTPIPMDSS